MLGVNQPDVPGPKYAEGLEAEAGGDTALGPAAPIAGNRLSQGGDRA
jgi:hypothetical protein